MEDTEKNNQKPEIDLKEQLNRMYTVNKEVAQDLLTLLETYEIIFGILDLNNLDQSSLFLKLPKIIHSIQKDPELQTKISRSVLVYKKHKILKEKINKIRKNENS